MSFYETIASREKCIVLTHFNYITMSIDIYNKLINIKFTLSQHHSYTVQNIFFIKKQQIVNLKIYKTFTLCTKINLNTIYRYICIYYNLKSLVPVSCQAFIQNSSNIWLPVWIKISFVLSFNLEEKRQNNK